MARYDRTIDIDAPPATVWSVIEDVEAWPQWTPSILSVVRESSGPFGLNSAARVKPKGFPESLLRVTEFTPGRSFTWEGSGGIGMRVVLAHAVEPTPSGGSRATLSFIPAGPSAVIMGWLAARMARNNVNTEAESLKRRAESLAAPGK